MSLDSIRLYCDSKIIRCILLSILNSSFLSQTFICQIQAMFYIDILWIFPCAFPSLYQISWSINTTWRHNTFIYWLHLNITLNHMFHLKSILSLKSHKQKAPRETCVWLILSIIKTQNKSSLFFIRIMQCSIVALEKQ